MNSKMTAVANEIGNSIFKFYNEDYLDTLFSGGFVIEDVIFQILVECCRYAYLKWAEKKPLKYYIDRDGLELELARKVNKRTIEYTKKRFDIEGERLKKYLGITVNKPDIKPVKVASNRYPQYELSEFDYWEICNIDRMDMVKAIVERRIGYSKKISVGRFIKMANQYDAEMTKYKNRTTLSPEDMVFSSLVLFTLQGKYAFDFYYEIATEMEKSGVKEIPNMHDRLMGFAGSYKCAACLPDFCPQYACDDDRWIEYPLILQRRRFLPQIVNSPDGGPVELILALVMEVNVLANAVQSHIGLNGQPMRTWFEENTDITDWASVFEAYDAYRTFIPEKEWTEGKIQAVRKMYNTVSFDYKA